MELNIGSSSSPRYRRWKRLGGVYANCCDIVCGFQRLQSNALQCYERTAMPCNALKGILCYTHSVQFTLNSGHSRVETVQSSSFVSCLPPFPHNTHILALVSCFQIKFLSRLDHCRGFTCHFLVQISESNIICLILSAISVACWSLVNFHLSQSQMLDADQETSEHRCVIMDGVKSPTNP